MMKFIKGVTFAPFVPSGCLGTEEAKESLVKMKERTGADFLAVSIGTQHGVYKAEPHLDIPRLQEIRAAVDAPLVLHGGSGLSDEDFRNTISGGIAKINVYTDIILAGKRALAEHPDASYTDGLCLAREAMKEATVKKLRVFGSAGKA